MNETPDRLATPRERASAAKHAWSRGARPDALAVLENDPELLANKSAAVDLAYEEYCRRTEAGAPPDPEAFVARFPAAYQNSLRNVLLAHAILMENPPALDEPAPQWPEAGERVGDLTLLRELGRGAFARVFLATEASTGERLVAVKFSPGGAAEARMHGRLEHPNIVPLLSVHRDEARGLTAVRMPYRGSATLEDVLGRAFPAGSSASPGRAALLLEVAATGLPPGFVGDPADPLLARGGYVEGVLHLGAQVADALALLHERGVCHRDLKPSNVLLSPGGRPLLLDFNLSADAVSPHVGGTVPYMAPEQLEAFLGRGAGAPRPDGRADLFSLGVILYELLTGRHPFGPVSLKLPPRELALALLEAQRRGCQPLRLRGDRRLARLVEGCLALEPAARPVSAKAVAAALRRQLGWLPRLRRWALRRPSAAACLATGLALVGAGAGWAGSALVPTPRHTAALAAAVGGPESEYSRGLEELRAGRLAEADDWFGRAVTHETKESRYWFAWGVARMKLAAIPGPGGKEYASSKFAAAADALQAALDIQQDDRARRRLAPGGGLGLIAAHLAVRPGLAEGQTLACMAYCAARQQRSKQALDLSSQAIGAGLAPAEVWNNYAAVLVRESRLKEAAPLLEEVLKGKPDFTAALYNRAILACHLRENQGPRPANSPLPTQALQDIDKVLATSPAGDHPYYRACLLYAFAALDLSHRASPRYALTALDLARDAVTKSRYEDQAVENLRLALDHGHPGDFEKELLFQKVLARHPEYKALLQRGPAPGPAAPASTLSMPELAEPPVESLTNP